MQGCSNFNDMTFRATGSINTRRFVAPDAGLISGFGVKQALVAGITQVVIGISQDFDRDPAGLNGSVPGLAAGAGDSVIVKGWGQIAMLQLGTGGATAWLPLVPDAAGKGVAAAATAGVTHCALALEPGIADDFIRVLVLPPNQATVI